MSKKLVSQILIEKLAEEIKAARALRFEAERLEALIGDFPELSPEPNTTSVEIQGAIDFNARCAAAENARHAYDGAVYALREAGWAQAESIPYKQAPDKFVGCFEELLEAELSAS